jgi:glycosyltransferase involved in cell wall biosynthesis
MTVAEALAAGTPCLVRDTTGLRDWIESQGVDAVNDVSPDTIAQSIKKYAGSSGPPQDSHRSWSDVATDLCQMIYSAKQLDY